MSERYCIPKRRGALTGLGTRHDAALSPAAPGTVPAGGRRGGLRPSLLQHRYQYLCLVLGAPLHPPALWMGPVAAEGDGVVVPQFPQL